MTQLLGASTDILNGVIDVVYTQRGRSRRCQLHQSDRAFARYRMLAKTGFGLDDSAQESRIKAVFPGIPLDSSMNFLLRIARIDAVVVRPSWCGGGSDQQTQDNERTSNAQDTRTRPSFPYPLDSHSVRLHSSAQEILHRSLESLKFRAQMAIR